MRGDADEDGKRVIADGILIEAERAHILDGTKSGRGGGPAAAGSGRGGRFQGGRVEDAERIVAEDEQAIDGRGAAQIRDRLLLGQILER